MSSNTPDSPRIRGNPFHSQKSRPAPIPRVDPSGKKPVSERSGEEAFLAVGDRPHNTNRPRAGSTSSQLLGRTPARSFVHRSFHGQLDPVHYSSNGLRDQTAELASLAVLENPSVEDLESADAADDRYPAIIREVSEPVTPEEYETSSVVGEPSHSALTDMLQDMTTPTSPTHNNNSTLYGTLTQHSQDTGGRRSMDSKLGDNERTALLHDRKASIRDSSQDVERQPPFFKNKPKLWQNARGRARNCVHILSHPKTWNPRAVWHELVVHPASLIPAVFLGLLLNILDALSYGMILFPLGHPLFDALGPDGIAMFYVSTVIAQVVYSSGGSTFRGGIGSEMIEVVPFFHKMAFTILDRIGEDDPKSVLATTILAFAVSSIITGAVFFLMGACGLGALIGFFPRHILIGCIGGVGWFLVVTGVEVSARLDGNLEYNLATLKQLFRADTVQLWIVPLTLAVILMVLQRFVKSNFLVGGYFIVVAAIFYIVKAAFHIDMTTLHDHGWIFDSPPSDKPWYHFYTLYDFGAVHWGALADTIPAMFALTFFGILHVPINVPALGISTGEDNLNVDRELIAHGISNCLSGLFGSIQNYLVYTNSLLFMDSGGNDRLAGLMLAAATLGVLMVGPVIIGYIPIMVVGALIFLLGIELLEEALVDTFGKVHWLEYATILVIVVTMGVWDFVAGILVGIVLAALNFVVQTSRRTAIRATFSGNEVHSTVRRPPVQLKFLRETGQQIYILKLAGFLFFGTIVGVENRIRALLDEDAFSTHPLRFLVLDMAYINGVDFSAAEAFTRINRLLQKKDVELVVSGLELDNEIGRAFRNVGLLKEDSGVVVFQTLNDALENCENQLLKALYRQQESRRSKRIAGHLDVPRKGSSEFSSSYRAEFLVSSPRHNQLHEAATTTLAAEPTHRQRWYAFKQPLPLLLQVFEDLSDRNEDFWHRAVPYFERLTFPQATPIFQVGDSASAFYLLEEGMLRADYMLPQGSYAELIVAGRPCGELPFFSDTLRTANMLAEKDSIVWQLTAAKWQELQKNESDVAQELLKMSLKLTKERMDAITSYVLTTAS